MTKDEYFRLLGQAIGGFCQTAEELGTGEEGGEDDTSRLRAALLFARNGEDCNQ